MSNTWRWKRSFCGFTVRFSWRSPGSLGRFGGGWNWQVGVQVGGSSILFSLLVAELSFSKCE